jgi:DNA-binding NtrC family response regulator
VVEDDARVREMTRRALEGAGYQVMEAETGDEALDVVARATDRVALVLTDVVMPGMSGPELARRVGGVAPGTPVLLMSGYPDGEIGRRGLPGADASFIQKPFTPEALLQTVRRAIAADGRRPGDPG